VEKFDGWTRALSTWHLAVVGRLLKVELTLAFMSRIVRSFIFEQSSPKSVKTPSRRGQSWEMCDKNKVKGSVAQHSLIANVWHSYLTYSLNSVNSGRLTSALLYPSERSSKINTLPRQRRSDLVTPATLSRLGPMDFSA
jgi:hypothetical protein